MQEHNNLTPCRKLRRSYAQLQGSRGEQIKPLMCIHNVPLWLMYTLPYKYERCQLDCIADCPEEGITSTLRRFGTQLMM